MAAVPRAVALFVSCEARSLLMAGDADTIFALASAAGRAGIAVVRISGPRARSALERLAQIVPAPRAATRVRLSEPTDGSALDDGLALWFPAPKSFTGEDVVELHLHGGRAVIAGVLTALGREDGCRLAEPGEFTRRAFENGKLDLTEAEGLADLINAETEAQRRLALRQLDGELHRAAEGWRNGLLRAQALMEAAIDFADEADVSDRAAADALEMAGAVKCQLERALADDHRGEILREGYKVVILGAPNVGKSSLINALAKRDAAIVSPEAGTTRDMVELHLNLGGRAVILTDTAGIRSASGFVEAEGIRRGLARARDADLVLWVVDASTPQDDFPPEFTGGDRDIFVVVNKIDLVASHPDALRRISGVRPGFAVSANCGDGIFSLEKAIAQAAEHRTRGGEAALITTTRHRQHIRAAHAALSELEAGTGTDLELRAEDLRRAALEIGRLVGRVDVEEILGEIFGRFCIGK